MEIGLIPGDFAFDGDPATPRTEGTPTTTQFLAHVYCSQTAAWIKMPLGTEAYATVLVGDPAVPPLKGHSPQFSANVRCGQTAGWMKTPLGTEVDLGPGHIVLDGVPALRERNTAVPRFFRPMSIVATVAHLSYC